MPDLFLCLTTDIFSEIQFSYARKKCDIFSNERWNQRPKWTLEVWKNRVFIDCYGMSHRGTIFCEIGNDLDEAHQLNKISTGYF